MKAFIFVLLAMAIALVASFPAADLESAESSSVVELERANRVARSSAWDEDDHGTIKEITVHKTVHVPYPVEKKVPVVVEKKVPVVITKTIPVSIKIKRVKHHHSG
ncbi:uncharacterized protein LOC110674643 [Aedes aegypti]|uniref:Uncharacterized protein n=1 Tax=Aedes aegypti TaxID=7159 RepID=A0A6I8U0N0_AEDAE|nr:uncharacterized protein LOC110674643 [Aedes aegypti]